MHPKIRSILRTESVEFKYLKNPENCFNYRDRWWYPYGGDQVGKRWIPNALNPINCPTNETIFKNVEIIFWIFFAQIIWGIFGTVVGCFGTMANNQSGSRNTVNG